MSNKDVNKRLYKINRLFRKPSLIHDTKLSVDLSPVADGTRPFLCSFKCCKVQRFKQCRIAWKYASLTVKQRVKEEAEIQKKTQNKISELNRTIQFHEEIQSKMQSQIEELKKIPDTITVLFLASNPTDTQSLRLDAECRAIQEMIRKSDYRDTIRFETRWAVRTSDLLQAINEVNPDRI